MLRNLHLGFNVLAMNPRLFSYLWWSLKSFNEHLQWQAVSDWFQHGFSYWSSVSKHDTNFASEVFHSKFDGNILCTFMRITLCQQPLGQLNHDLRESHHELSRNGRRLLMWPGLGCSPADVFRSLKPLNHLLDCSHLMCPIRFFKN